MSPELKQAVEERVALGHTKEQIAAELEAAGYDHESIEMIYASVTGVDQAATTNVQSLPRNRDLFKAAWGFMVSRLDLVAWLAVPSVALGVLTFLNTSDFATESLAQTVLSVIATIALFLFTIVVQVAVIYAALKHSKGETLTIKQGITWATNNFFGWIWLVLLTGLVIMGGWLLLIVPGIIAAVYVAFSQYVFVDEGGRGLAALQRSRQLVYGKFASVVWRMFVMTLFLVALYVPVAILAGLILASVPEATATLITVVLEGLVSGFIGVLAAYYMTTIYQSLKLMPLVPVAPTSWYKVYAGVGVLFVIAIVGLSLAFMSALTELGDDMQTDTVPTAFQAEQAELDAEMQAELEAFQQQFQAEFESN